MEKHGRKQIWLAAFNTARVEGGDSAAARRQAGQCGYLSRSRTRSYILPPEKNTELGNILIGLREHNDHIRNVQAHTCTHPHTRTPTQLPDTHNHTHLPAH